ncbi:MAG: hypothetical protein WB014_06095 [Methanosarcina sp.]
MENPIFRDCMDCDGSCIGSTTCGDEGYAVCRACQTTGCLVTLEAYNNPPEDCKTRRAEALRVLIKFEESLEELLVSGPSEGFGIQMSQLSDERTHYRVCSDIWESIYEDLLDAGIPCKFDIESGDYVIIEVNKSDIFIVDKILVGYD